MKSYYKALCLIFLSFFITDLVQGQQVNHWETVVFNNDTWKYFVGTSEPDANWRSLTFNDVEIARAGISGTHPTYNQFGIDHEAAIYLGGLPESFYIEKKQLKTLLLSGENVLAIQVHNSSTASSDMSSNAFLSFGIINTSNNYRPVPNWFPTSADFTSSNLPIVVINTKPGEKIVDAPKITADMKIIYHANGIRNYSSDSGNVYNGKVGIEIRGAYSASLPQKPYGFETRDNTGNKLNVSLLGMPSENDWMLLANYNDKTFLRNVLAFDIFHKMGNYSTRMRFCEVVLNNDYQGIYLLGEKIKQDSGRVNIAKLKPEDNNGDDVTGGYIIKTDYFTATDSWKSNFSPLNKPGADVYYVYHDPKPEVLTVQQKTYIQGFINTLESVLYNPSFRSPVFGYKSYIDINSFADYFILGEVTRNVDTYKKSRFLYKDKDSKDGLLHSGPSWDFDWAWRNLLENCVHFNQTDGSGWAYKINECAAWPVPPSWEIRMLQDNDFASLIHNRYFELRKTILSQTAIENTIDSVATLINEAQFRHFQKWNILGINTGTPEYGVQPTTYSGVIILFKNWINTRLTWLDANMIGPALSVEKNPADQIKCRVFPNPVSNILYIESDKEISSIALFNITGIQVIEKSNLCDYSVSIDLTGLNPGLYIARIVLSNGNVIVTRVVKR